MRLALVAGFAALAARPAFVPPQPSRAKAEVTFPATGDTATISKDPHIWNQGDAIVGVRETQLTVATSLVGTWDVKNYLDPNGHLPVDVTLNGVKIGSFVVTEKDGSSVPIELHFPAVAGPRFTLRYEVMTSVESGAGSVQTTWDASKLSLR